MHWSNEKNIVQYRMLGTHSIVCKRFFILQFALNDTIPTYISSDRGPFLPLLTLLRLAERKELLPMLKYVSHSQPNMHHLLRLILSACANTLETPMWTFFFHYTNINKITSYNGFKHLLTFKPIKPIFLYCKVPEKSWEMPVIILCFWFSLYIFLSFGSTVLCMFHFAFAFIRYN